MADEVYENTVKGRRKKLDDAIAEALKTPMRKQGYTRTVQRLGSRIVVRVTKVDAQES